MTSVAFADRAGESNVSDSPSNAPPAARKIEKPGDSQTPFKAEAAPGQATIRESSNFAPPARAGAGAGCGRAASPAENAQPSCEKQGNLGEWLAFSRPTALCGGADACDPCLFVGDPGRFWARADYLVYWTKGMRIPPLVTATVPPSTNPPILGLPTTAILFGGERQDAQDQPGFRVAMGFWLDPCHTWAIEGDYMGLHTGRRELHDRTDGPQ